MDTKAVCKSLDTGKRNRFLAKKEIEAMQAYTSEAMQHTLTRRYGLLGDTTASVLWVQ